MKHKILIYKDNVCIVKRNVANNKGIHQVRQQADRLMNDVMKQHGEGVYRYEIEGFKHENESVH